MQIALHTILLLQYSECKIVPRNLALKKSEKNRQWDYGVEHNLVYVINYCMSTIKVSTKILCKIQ